MLNDEYHRWIEDVEPLSRSDVFYTRVAQLTGELRYGILGCGVWTAEQLTGLIDALIAQDNECWELLLPRQSGQSLFRTASSFCRDVQDRIIFVDCDNMADRAAMLQSLLAASQAGWCFVLDPDDAIDATALGEFDNVIGQFPTIKMMYSDEDRITSDGNRSAPAFKPGYSPQMLQSYNYFGRITVFNRLAALAIGGFRRSEGLGAEWGLNLRLSTASAAESHSIVRVPRVLCHRAVVGQRERDIQSSREAADHRATLTRYWQDIGIPSPHVATLDDGTQRSHWRVEPQPMVSVIIPNRNQADLLRSCVEGVLEKTDYKNIEVIIVENNSTDDSVWKLYEEFQDKYGILVRCWDQPFNYSAVCNFGAEMASGQLLLFLNNDIEVEDKNWLNEMVRVAMLPGVGVVGLKLVYPDGVLQHAGVAIGIHLYALMFHRAHIETWGVFGSQGVMRNWMAVMGACQMIHRAVFDSIGQYDEGYKIANSDVALCLRAVEAGWRVAYTPFASLIHHEGKTRGHTNPSSDMARAALELQQLRIDEDPFLHPQLSSTDSVPRLIRRGERSITDNLAHLKIQLLSPDR